MIEFASNFLNKIFSILRVKIKRIPTFTTIPKFTRKMLIQYCNQNQQIYLMSSLHIKQNIEQSSIDQFLAQSSRTIDPSLQLQIKNKYRTFTTFNYRHTYRQHKIARKKKDESKLAVNTITEALTSFMLGSLTDSKEQQKSKSKKGVVAQQLAGIKSERRERFKKTNNTLLIIKHYMEKQNFKPTQQQMYLMKSLAELKQVSDQYTLDVILKKIYQYMNQAVDLNQMRFLCLSVVLTADICFQFRDFNRAFYFYNEAKHFSSYNDLFYIKTEALIAMGNICIQLKFYEESIKIYKKGLQYAWKTKNLEHQLLIYDLLGSAYYYQGNLKQSQYYHKRFTQGQFESNDSAIKKISIEMLAEYEKYISSLQKKNLTSLFLEYLNIPIVDLNTIPPLQKTKLYDNYDQEKQSPRRRRGNKILQFIDFPSTRQQILKLLRQDYQFKTQIPNPDVQQNFAPTRQYGKPRKDMSFQQTAEYHKIMGKGDKNPINLNQIRSNSLQERIQMALSQKPNQDWWLQIKDKIRKNQLQKVGRLRDRIFNSHLSYSKQKRRSFSLKNQKIKQTFNKTLLDWIDPPK